MIELIVVLAILGGLVVVTGLAWRSHDPEGWKPPLVEGAAAVESARRQALSSGAPVEITLERSGSPTLVTALPDGRVLGAEEFGWDPLSGRRRPTPEGRQR
jgi:hypothetical protein